MTARRFYFKDAVPPGATLHRSLQMSKPAPARSTTGTGWIAGTNAAGQSCIQKGGSQYPMAGSNWGSTLQPSAVPSTTLGDCWRSENPINGKFANADWKLAFRMVSSASAYTGRFKLGVRIWRSTDPSGAGATEITAGRITSEATTANLRRDAVLSVPVIFSPGAETVLANEYLFFSVGLEITSAGSDDRQDILFRVGPLARITTTNFTPGPKLRAAMESGIDTASAQVAIATTAIPSGHFVIALHHFKPVIELSRNKPTILMTKSNLTIRLKEA